MVGKVVGPSVDCSCSSSATQPSVCDSTRSSRGLMLLVSARVHRQEKPTEGRVLFLQLREYHLQAG